MGFCCRRAEQKQEQVVGENKPTKQQTEFEGRVYKTQCAARFFQITLVVGVIIGILGGLALASLLLPNAGSLTPIFQKISGALSTVALKLASDPMSLAVLTTSVGGALVVSSIIGWAVESCKQKELKRTNSTKTKEEELPPQQPRNSKEIVPNQPAAGGNGITLEIPKPTGSGEQIDDKKNV